MKVIKTPIDGFIIIQPDVFKDNRGFFLETFQEKKYKELGIKDKFVQDNQSRSFKGVLRGMHFQHMFPQAQIVTVMCGSILDVGVDLRPNSETFGQWYGVQLSDNESPQVYMAPGIAHGYYVQSEFVDLHYKVSRYYNPADERGLLWNDPTVNINWPKGRLLLNDRDIKYPLLSDLINDNQLPVINNK